MPTTCHNCRHPLSLRELAAIESEPRVAEVVRYFGQAACDACCDKAKAQAGLDVARSIARGVLARQPDDEAESWPDNHAPLSNLPHDA